jgi:hypothetical protein
MIAAGGAIALSSAAGCELFVSADRDAIRHGTGGGGATSSSGGSSVASGGGSVTSVSSSSSAGGLPCIHPFDCPGADSDCVARTCLDGHCGQGPVPAGTPTSTQISGDCQREVCDGAGAAKLVDDDLDLPDDGNPCTDEACVAGVPYAAPSAALTPCNQDGGALCDGVGHCVGCTADAQCGGGVCVDNACVIKTCLDGVKDGAETDVDCGGSTCVRCGVGKGCALDGDCASAVCSGGLCNAPRCSDTVKNGLETDVDCGGPCPLGCAAGLSCAVDGDCRGGACAGGACLPTCSDGARDAAETDVDCGGGGCAPCALSKGCALGVDCASGVCTSGVCKAPAASCGDAALDGTETDVDCGGPACPPCAVGKACGAATDCAARRCVGGACAPRILIAQARSRGAGGTHDELVSLYNPGAAPVTLDASWTLTTRSAIGDCVGDAVKPLFTGGGQVIAPHGHLLLAGAAYAQMPAADAALAAGGLADAASLVLSQGADVVDALCYAYDAATTANLTGCAVPYVCEGAPASNLPHDNTTSAASTVDASLERRPGGALGHGADSGASSVDFRAASPTKPEGSTSPPAP